MQPIITQRMFTSLGISSQGENINGPTVIRIPDWIAPENRANPDAKYYIYFAHHKGEYIRMVWATEIEGLLPDCRTGGAVCASEGLGGDDKEGL